MAPTGSSLPLAFDITQINHENLPMVISAMVVQNAQIVQALDSITKKLEEHDECLQLFRFSKCQFMPWLGRNKWLIGVIFTCGSVWLAAINFSMDWITRLIQWNGQLP
jgi:hypothetical protein